ncbi:EF-hand calcium-binding domain-containing protein 6 [Chlamydotis macqueenii]
MARVLTAEDLSALQPFSQGITLTPRPRSTRNRASLCGSRRHSTKSSPGLGVSDDCPIYFTATSVSSVPGPTLFSWDIGQILLQKTAEKEDELKKAFQMLDVGRTLTVTKDEFRRVIETFLFHLTEAEFDAVLAQIPNIGKVTVPYLDFLSKFTKVARNTSMLKRLNSHSRQTMTLSQLESLLKEKVLIGNSYVGSKMNFSDLWQEIVSRYCRLFDYSHSGWIRRHTLRQILEITCFTMKDSEFEKLWNHYCVRDCNVMDYKEFLKNFGISTDTVKEKSTENNVPAYQDIEKAFRAIDVSQSGFVSLDYLKLVINDFVFPLPNETFQELMNRFGLKTTGKISWQQFLEKFQDPGSTFENRQTIPMRKNHKVNPARGDEDFSSDTVLQKLHRYIRDAYPSLKQAFLMLDEKQDGKITRNDLHNVLHNLVFQLKDKDFQELMEIVDPEQTGYLDYHKFLDLLEEKESIVCISISTNSIFSFVLDILGSGFERYQKSTAVSRDAQKEGPIEQPWKVEEFLSDKITENWKDFCKALQSYDPKCTGTINRSHLRKVLQLCCPSLSDQQFMKLCYKYKDKSSDGIFYKMLLDNLKGAVLSGDLNGISSHISKEKQQREEKRQTELSERIKQIEDQANKYTQNRTVDEVIKSLKDRVIQQAATIKDSFFAYNKQSNGKINKAGLQKVLEDHGMPLDDSQFNLLTERLGLPDGGLSYQDFVATLEDARLNGPGATLLKCPNNRVDDAKFHYVTAEECLNQLNDKLMEFYGDTYSAFRKTDSNRDGIINMPDFRKLLESFLLHLRDEEFPRLLDLLGMNMTSTLNYKEFHQLFHTQETNEIPPRLMPSHKKKEITDAELACDDAHYYLVIKARTRWHDLARNFQGFDSEGNGIIQSEDLKKVLFSFGIPITPEEFKQLWARYDTDAKGYLTHQEFLQKLGIDFVPTDTGLSRHITEDSYVRLQAPYNKQKKDSNLEEQQKQQTNALHVRKIKKQITDKFRDYFQDFSEAFHKVDKNRDGYVTVSDLHRILQELNCYLDHDQFRSLLNSLGISIHDSKLSYFDFLRAIDDGRASKYQQRQKQAAPPASFAALSLEQTLIKIKEIVASSYDLLYKAFSLFDKEDTGVVKALEFRQVLDHFCFKLSDKQFRHLLKNVNLCENFTVDWKVFLKNIKHLIKLVQELLARLHRPDNKEFADMIVFQLAEGITGTEEEKKVIPPKSSRDLSESGILSQIREVVTANFNTIAQEFKDLDSSKDNTVSKEQFWDICNRHFQQLTEEQFENLWNTVDVSADGRLKYQDFLKKSSSELVTTPSRAPSVTSSATSTKPATHAGQDSRVSSQLELPKTHSSLVVQTSITASSRPQTTTMCSAPVLNCETIENKIRMNIQHSWRGILKACKEKDVSKLGEISVSDFQDIAEKFNLDLSEREMKQITTKYDLKQNGRFAYYDFLQSCILLLKQQESSLLHRVTIQKPKKPLSPGLQTASFLKAMLRIQPQIMHCWRPMKRTFKSYDECHTGLINIADFRQVLHEYSIDLTEGELFHISEYYDKTLSSKISYNDFLRAFLQ